MRALITGSAGFMGHALAERFRNDMEVIGTARAQARDLPWRQLLHDWRYPLYSVNGLKSDIFIHAAFNTAADINETLARNAAEAALRMEAGKVILLSTGSVYGERDEVLTERTPLADREKAQPYARSSRTVEEIFQFFLAGVPLIVVRLFFPYGPGSSKERLISRLALRISKGEPVLLREDDKNEGRPRINPVFVDDASEAIFRLAQAKPSGGSVLTVNLGGPEVVSIRELGEKIAAKLGKKCRFEKDSVSPPAHDQYCSSKLLSMLTGFTPSVKLDSGLHATLKGLNLSK